MGRGRRPTPTKLKIVKGNPGRRPLNEDEPQPNLCRPKQPKHMGERAKSAWKFVADVLDEMGVLSEADSLARERLVECYVEIWEAQQIINAEGRVYETTGSNGEPMKRSHPAVKQLQDADRRFKSYLVEFGLTPSARSKVKTSGKEKKSSIEDYFG